MSQAERIESLRAVAVEHTARFDALQVVKAERVELMCKARSEGFTVREIAEHVGLTFGQVHQLTQKSAPNP